MKLQVLDHIEEYAIQFKRDGENIILVHIPEELLASLCCLSYLPIDGARLPRHLDVMNLLIATTTDPDIDDVYGENEYPIEVTYNAYELEQIKMLFDQ